MNDTTRDELRDEILGYFEQINSHLDSHDSFTDAEMRSNVNEIIALVTAARDAEIRKRLLSEEAVDHAAAVRDWTGCGFTSPRDTSRWLHMDPGIKEWEREQVRATLQAALDHIGLHGDGTGGQG